MAHVYHWRHGWIPLDHEAALKKTRGNHDAAKRMLADARSPEAGMHSRKHVVHAATTVHEVHSADRPDAVRQVHAAADRHSVDLPGRPAKGNVSSLGDKRDERAAQTPRQIHDRLTSDPSKVSDAEITRLVNLGGRFAPAARAEQAKRDAAKTKASGASEHDNFNWRTGKLEHGGNAQALGGLHQLSDANLKAHIAMHGASSGPGKRAKAELDKRAAANRTGRFAKHSDTTLQNALGLGQYSEHRAEIKAELARRGWKFINGRGWVKGR